MSIQALLFKEIFIPKKNYLRASYVEVDVSDPDHVNSRLTIQTLIERGPQLEDISVKRHHRYQCPDIAPRPQSLPIQRGRKIRVGDLIKENYGIDFLYQQVIQKRKLCRAFVMITISICYAPVILFFPNRTFPWLYSFIDL